MFSSNWILFESSVIIWGGFLFFSTVLILIIFLNHGRYCCITHFHLCLTLWPAEFPLWLAMCLDTYILLLIQVIAFCRSFYLLRYTFAILWMLIFVKVQSEIYMTKLKICIGKKLFFKYCGIFWLLIYPSVLHPVVSFVHGPKLFEPQYFDTSFEDDQFRGYYIKSKYCNIKVHHLLEEMEPLAEDSLVLAKQVFCSFSCISTLIS